MLKKSVLTLGFVFLTILIMGGSCGGGGPTAKLGNVSDTSLTLTAQAGATATASFTFENTGDATLEFTISESENFLAITQGATGTVAPSATATVTLVATCTTEGTLNGTVSVESNGGDAEIDVVVDCTAPTAQLDNLSDTSLSLTDQVGSSATDSVTFENTGQANLTYTTSVSGAFLEVTQGASGTVTPGATATVVLEATCTTQGTFNGNVSIDSNGGDATVAVTLTCTPAPVSGYDIDLRFIGGSTSPAQQASFEQAALRWEAVITGDLQDISGSALPAGPYCDIDEEDISSETIDDVIIFAKVGFIDGPGTILAQAGPVLVRTSDDLTIVGCMLFDEDDIDDLTAGGSFTDVVTHEMGHVLGIGTFWDSFFDTTCPNSGVVGFTGVNAIREFNTLIDNPGGSDKPRVESNTGQGGTDCGHWDEGVFGNELMTGFAEAPGVTMPLARLTIGSLEDLGYQVDYSLADSYNIPACSPTCTALVEPQAQNQAWEILLKPKAAVSSNGDVVFFEPPK